MKAKWFSTIWPALLWSMAIFILLVIPGRELPQGPEVPSLDKIIHAFLFGMQVWLWCTYFKRAEKFPRLSGVFLLILILSSLYGIGMEYVQKYFVTNRAFELGDIIADIAGSAIGWLIAFKYKQ
ncbi:MAG: VanZ family protein [Agriterribacter sp.]